MERLEYLEDRGRMGSNRMQKQELTAELAAVHISINFCREDVIKNQEATGKEKKWKEGGKGR